MKALTQLIIVLGAVLVGGITPEAGAASKLTGVVRDPTGAPVSGVKMSVFPNWGSTGGEARTDANGRYELSWNPQRFGGPDTTFCVIARDATRNLAVAHDLEEDATTVDLRLERGLMVAGRVEDAKGKPLANASVQLHLWSGNTGSSFDNKPLTTDAQGRFEFKALPADRRYGLWATAKGYGSANANIQPGDADTNRIELPPCVLQVADRKLAGQVLDAEDKPVAGVQVHVSGQGQPNASLQTDDRGRFAFNQVCEGQIQLFASSRNAYGNARAEGGDTNVILKLGVNESYSVRDTPKRPSLKGKPLPDLTTVELAREAAPAGKPILLCLFDIDQRPSRRFARLVSEQHDALKQKGITVLGLQAVIAPAESLKEWKAANPVPFAVGRVAEKSDKTKWASEVESLPWLILTDGDGRVTAEGFALEELETKLPAAPKAEQ